MIQSTKNVNHCEPKYQPFRRFIRNHFAGKLVKTLTADKIDAFRRTLGFNVIDAFSAKQHTLTKIIKEVFEGEDIQTEYSVSSYRIDLYCHKYKLAIVVDEFGHSDRIIDHEVKRQKATEKELGCKFFRINPDKENFNEKKLSMKYIDTLKNQLKNQLKSL